MNGKAENYNFTNNLMIGAMRSDKFYNFNNSGDINDVAAFACILSVADLNSHSIKV